MTIQRSGKTSSVDITAMHDNTSQEIVTITVDKLKLILIEHLSRIESNKAWQTPLSLIVTIILVFCSAEFKKALGISADSWLAIFFLGGVGCCVWLVVCLFRLNKSITPDDVIATIKTKT